MTQIAAASTGVPGEPKARRAGSSRKGPPGPDIGVVRTRRQQETAAVSAFTAWFQRQRQEGGIALPTESQLEVQSTLSKAFCIGMHEFRYFVGIPEDCLAWFRGMPWQHVEVSKGSSWLALRSLPAGGSGLPLLPAFSLNFNVQPPGYLAGLLHYHFIDVRSISRTSSEDAPYRISREVHATLDVRVSSPCGAMHTASGLQGVSNSGSSLVATTR